MNRERFFSMDSLSNYETYEKFLERIFSFQSPNFYFGVERLYPSNSVNSKVESDGNFKRFVGDTVVFNLDGLQKKFIHEHFIEPLYRVAPNCFAEKLDESMLHMTLHDLNSSEKEDEKLMVDMLETEIMLYEIINDIGIKSDSIAMKITCVFNMVNTSLVLGLVPKTEEDYHKLMKLYQMVEYVHKLPYPFTPHITLAYYSREGISGEDIKKLEDLINELNKESFEISLSTDMLFYQKFVSMNEYFNIMGFVKKN